MPLIRPLGTFSLSKERLMLAREREVRAWTCKQHRVLLLWEYTDLFFIPLSGIRTESDEEEKK